MGRMYGPGKGMAGSALPYRRTPPAWLKVTSRDLVKQIVDLAKKGMAPSMIGLTLRDSVGVAQVKSVTGRKIVRILKAHGRAPELPEDLYCLITRAVSMRKHLDRHRTDMDTKFRLILVESRIHRLARYYKGVRRLPPTFKYESVNAASMVAA
jgi:small subunit ribosomal protein S13e